jgi:hypothetical protein
MGTAVGPELHQGPRHGLFTWTPLYVLCVLGWLLLARKDWRLALLILLAFSAETLVNAAIGDWWASDSFGQRRFLGLSVLFAVGLAEVLAAAARRPLVPVALGLAGLAVWNLQFAAIYNSELLAPKDQAIALEPLVQAQAEVALQRSQRWLPRGLWVALYDGLSGQWIDEGARSLGGLVDLGGPGEPRGVVNDGWFSRPQTDGCVEYRESRGRWSQLVIPVRTPGAFRVTLRCHATFHERPVRMRLSFNQTELGRFEPPASWGDLVAIVPAQAVQPGLNLLELDYSTTPRDSGFRRRNSVLALDWLRFERLSGTTPR